MKHRPSHHSQAGFTIIELMIATLIFATILVVITAGVLHFSTDYYKGINSSITQTTSSNIINSISQAIQFGKPTDVSAPGASSGIGYVCTYSKEFVYYLGQEEPAAQSGVFEFSLSSGCYNDMSTVTTVANPDWANRQDLLQPHMRLSALTVTGPSGPNLDTWAITVGVAYGDPDLLCDTHLSGHGGCGVNDPAFTETGANGIEGDIQASSTIVNDLHCKSQTGSQFCDVANLSTTVQSRL